MGRLDPEPNGGRNRSEAGLTAVRFLTMLNPDMRAEVAEWQTRRTQNPVPVMGVWVQVPPSVLWTYVQSQPVGLPVLVTNW